VAVSLLALADGTASLYFSNGGGIIGAGQKERPAIVARHEGIIYLRIVQCEPVAAWSLLGPGYQPLIGDRISVSVRFGANPQLPTSSW
jgi:hypothetical protein